MFYTGPPDSNTSTWLLSHSNIDLLYRNLVTCPRKVWWKIIFKLKLFIIIFYTLYFYLYTESKKQRLQLCPWNLWNKFFLTFTTPNQKQKIGFLSYILLHGLRWITRTKLNCVFAQTLLIGVVITYVCGCSGPWRNIISKNSMSQDSLTWMER